MKAGMNETGLLDAVKRLEYDKKRGEGPKQDQEPKTEQMLRRRMEGYSIGGEEQFDFHGDCFCCVAVKIKNMQEVEKRYEQRGMDLFFRSLFSILEQGVAGI